MFGGILLLLLGCTAAWFSGVLFSDGVNHSEGSQVLLGVAVFILALWVNSIAWSLIFP